MVWIVFWILSLVTLVTGMSVAIYKGRHISDSRVVTPFKLAFIALFISAVFIFIPIYLDMFRYSDVRYINTFLLSVHNAIRLFIVDGEFGFVSEYVKQLNNPLSGPYELLAGIIFTVAPFMTFGFVLSFFSNISAYIKFILSFGRTTYVFSKPSRKTITLAKSICEEEKDVRIVFCDVNSDPEPEYEDYIQEAKKLNSILFKKDIALIRYKTTFFYQMRKKRKKVTKFVLINNDDNETFRQAQSLLSEHRDDENVWLYVFSGAPSCKFIVEKERKESDKIKYRRIDEKKEIVYRLLEDEGKGIFKDARDETDSDKGAYVKTISKAAREKTNEIAVKWSGKNHKIVDILVVGVGAVGSEIIKTFSWAMQMNTEENIYRVRINAFDKRGDFEEHFKLQCKEFFAKQNADWDSLDGLYDVKFHSGIDVNTAEFEKKIDDLYGKSESNYPTCIFLCLGNDDSNIEMGIKLRRKFCYKDRNGKDKTKIWMVIHEQSISKSLMDIGGRDEDTYKFKVLGDFESRYSNKTLSDGGYKSRGLSIHTAWSPKKISEFWYSEYSYGSSVAMALHLELVKKMNEENPPSDRDIEEYTALEHSRWNVYMRSEGFSRADKNDKMKMTHPAIKSWHEFLDKDEELDKDGEIEKEIKNFNTIIQKIK